MAPAKRAPSKPARMPTRAERPSRLLGMLRSSDRSWSHSVTLPSRTRGADSFDARRHPAWAPALSTIRHRGQGERTLLTVEPRDERGSRASRRLRAAGPRARGRLRQSTATPCRSRSTAAACAPCWPRGTRSSTSRSTAAAAARDHQGPAARPGARARSSTSTSCRVRLDEKIQSTVPLELEGAEDAPGVKEGGVLEHVTREVTVEALPTDIPDRIVANVAETRDRRDHDAATLSARRPASRSWATSRRSWSRPITAPSEVEERRGDRGGGRARRRGGRGAGGRGGARRRGRGRGRRRPPSPARSSEEAPVCASFAAAAGAPPSGRLSDRRARQPRLAVRRHTAQRRLRGRERARRALGAAAGAQGRSAGSSPKGGPGPAARASRCCCRRPT